MAAQQRSPFGAQPRRRAIFVERPLSSIKIRCSGSKSSWPSTQFSRAAFTSARSCSLAWAVFFCASDHAGRATSTRQSSPPSHRSEEHTSELQSLRHLVCRLLLEKKK